VAASGNTAGSGNGGLNNEPARVLTQFDNRFVGDQASDVPLVEETLRWPRVP
jgi:hypothetical protein